MNKVDSMKVSEFLYEGLKVKKKIKDCNERKKGPFP